MNINQHNYEEFFLLYADGELSAQDKLAVEQFVQGNPYLAEELDMFMQLKLPVEEIVFEEKSLLLKQGEAISLKNYEEYFLLYVDNELDDAGKQSVETFVLQHPSLQEHFMLLKQTRLEPETIVFADKASLYRKEEKERPVFYMRWQRIAVAAALVGVVAFGWNLFQSDETINVPVTAQVSTATGNTSKSNTTTNVPAVETQSQNKVTQPTNEGSNTAIVPVRNIAQNTVATETATVIPENDVTKLPEERTTNERAFTVSTENPVEKKDPISTRLDNKRLSEKPMITAAKATEDNTADNLTQPAIYRELDTEDEKKSLYVGSLEINKDKLRGFFRKATSLFRGKAKQQEEEERTETTPSTNTRSLK